MFCFGGFIVFFSSGVGFSSSSLLVVVVVFCGVVPSLLFGLGCCCSSFSIGLVVGLWGRMVGGGGGGGFCWFTLN